MPVAGRRAAHAMTGDLPQGSCGDRDRPREPAVLDLALVDVQRPVGVVVLEPDAIARHLARDVAAGDFSSHLAVLDLERQELVQRLAVDLRRQRSSRRRGPGRRLRRGRRACRRRREETDHQDVRQNSHRQHPFLENPPQNAGPSGQCSPSAFERNTANWRRVSAASGQYLPPPQPAVIPEAASASMNWNEGQLPHGNSLLERHSRRGFSRGCSRRQSSWRGLTPSPRGSRPPTRPPAAGPRQ